MHVLVPCKQRYAGPSAAGCHIEWPACRERSIYTLHVQVWQHRLALTAKFELFPNNTRLWTTYMIHTGTKYKNTENMKIQYANKILAYPYSTWPYYHDYIMYILLHWCLWVLVGLSVQTYQSTVPLSKEIVEQPTNGQGAGHLSGKRWACSPLIHVYRIGSFRGCEPVIKFWSLWS